MSDRLGDWLTQADDDLRAGRIVEASKFFAQLNAEEQSMALAYAEQADLDRQIALEWLPIILENWPPYEEDE